MPVQAYSAEQIENLATVFPRRNEASFAWGNAMSYAMYLHGLRAFWPGIPDEDGGATDVSRGLTLCASGVVQYTRPFLVPMIDFSGATYLRRQDEQALRVSGLETYIPSADRGMTVGFWTIPTDVTTLAYLLSKCGASAADAGWKITLQADHFTFSISDGANYQTVTSTVISVINSPSFVVCRFVPSTKLDIFVNGVKTSNTTTIYASIAQTTQAFHVSGYTGVSLFTGEVGYIFLCSAALSDPVINALWHLTRPVFGV